MSGGGVTVLSSWRLGGGNESLALASGARLSDRPAGEWKSLQPWRARGSCMLVGGRPPDSVYRGLPGGFARLPAVERRRDPVPAPHRYRPGQRPGPRPLQRRGQHRQGSGGGPEVLTAPRRLAHHQQGQWPSRRRHPVIGTQLFPHPARQHGGALELDVVSPLLPGRPR